MAEATPFGATACWNCQQPMRAGADRCLWCGVALNAGPAAAAAPAAVAVPAAAAVAPVAAAPAPAAPAAPGRIVVGAPAIVVAARPAPVHTPLPAEFAGTSAGPGRQLLAWFIDLAVVAAVTVGVYLLTTNLALTVVTLVELAVALWVLEARTGATIGNLATRSRATRAAAPYSPGAARSALWRLVTAAGFVVGIGIGAAIVVASGFSDPTGQRRSWADRISGTRRVVALPKSARVAAVETTPAPSYLAAPVMSAPAIQLADDLELSDGGTGTTGAPQAAAAPLPLPTVAVAPLSAAPAVAAPPALAPAPGVEEAPAALAGVIAPDLESASGIESTVVTVLPTGVSMLLLVFDTGQRERVPTPAAINLGRSPTATEAGDRVIKVEDPESTVSKNHVRVEHSRGQTWVVDLGSTNGSTILGDDGTTTTLGKGDRRELEEGARVRIGNRTFTVNLILGGEG